MLTAFLASGSVRAANWYHAYLPRFRSAIEAEATCAWAYVYLFDVPVQSIMQSGACAAVMHMLQL